MNNTSGIKPVGHRLLVLPHKVEEKTESGIVIATSLVDKEQQAQVKAKVVEVGPGCWLDATVGNWVQAGDDVLIGKFTGLVLKGDDGEDYRMISDLDVIGKLG